MRIKIMDQRLKEILDNFEKMQIGLDDTFRFRCTMCGKCCRNREDILLNPFDLYRLAKGLGIAPEEVVDKYCDVYIGNSSRFPIVRLNSVGVDKRCPFLEGNCCSVHHVKPTVCALFPLGRYVKCEPGNRKLSDKTEYILQPITCGDKKENHTVREWLEQSHIPVDDEFFGVWDSVLLELSMAIHAMEKVLKEKHLLMVWNVIFARLYLKYDTEQEFQPQFEANAKSVKELVQEVEALIKEKSQ